MRRRCTVPAYRRVPPKGGIPASALPRMSGLAVVDPFPLP
ncbi:hypothetical protein HMPREF9603_01496 [Cutibacterium acnes HL001PA1]|nr:hypothetical protein HMPREF9603_01496 [Cutibacterium acnes HL001PA1]